MALSAPLIAYAHGGEARIELNVTQAGPGTTIDLRGVGFDPESAVTIMLVGADPPRLLGAATADEEGSFTQAVSLPVDLLPGAHEVRASDSHHSASALLTIAPAISSEENEQRDESEPLLAPFPTRVPDSIAATPATAPRAASQTAAVGKISAAWLLLPLGTLAVSGMALALRRRSG